MIPALPGLPALPDVSLNTMLIALAAAGFVLYLLVSRRYQKCPHCGAIGRRARRGWLRCRRCGRQYHRSVRLR